MDHDVDVRGRLDLDDYAISPVDTLFAKAQIGTINRKDVHDIIALFKDLPLREIDDDLSIYVPYIAEVCADDWGLYLDVTTNLQIVLDWLGDYGLSEEETARVHGRVTAVAEAIESRGEAVDAGACARASVSAWRGGGSRRCGGHADRHLTAVRPAARPDVVQAERAHHKAPEG